MPGYEPFLLCDFHVHTQWSDGKLPLREVVDLYGSTGKFDVIAITDHILMKKDLLARAGRIATLGSGASACARRTSTPTSPTSRRKRAAVSTQYGMLVVAGAEVTQNRCAAGRTRTSSRSTSRSTSAPISRPTPSCARSGGRARLSIACHPHHRPPRRLEISTCYLWDHRDELSDLVDVWEAANRDDLFSVTSLKHYPYVANSDFHKPKHLYSWKTLVRCEKNWPAIKKALRSNVDVALTLFRNGSWAA